MSASPITPTTQAHTSTDLRDAAQTLGLDERKHIAAETLRQLPRDDQDDVTESFQPGRAMTDWIWLIVVSAFAAVLVGSFATLALNVFWGDATGPGAQTMLTIFTSVVGFLAGLFVPSPVNKNHQG